MSFAQALHGCPSALLFTSFIRLDPESYWDGRQAVVSSFIGKIHYSKLSLSQPHEVFHLILFVFFIANLTTFFNA